MNQPQLKIQLIDKEGFKPTLEYKTQGSSGFDIQSSITCVLQAGETKAIPTNIRVEFDEAYDLQIRSRSGLALNKQVIVLNAPGTIDADYRGELCIILCNQHSLFPFDIKQGDRIAQGVLCPVIKPVIVMVDDLSETIRGDGGFGSTGI